MTKLRPRTPATPRLITAVEVDSRPLRHIAYEPRRLALEEFGSELRGAIVGGESGAATGDDDAGTLTLRDVDEELAQRLPDGFAVADDGGIGGLVSAAA